MWCVYMFFLASFRSSSSGGLLLFSAVSLPIEAFNPHVLVCHSSSGALVRWLPFKYHFFAVMRQTQHFMFPVHADPFGSRRPTPTA
ncbi:hypothetical protein EDD16DRAFT_1612860 [Pisolithus croceorrhizus]|nr:hypothetical protein EDD16DRAFT_1612860 [Pisolithus croceorrhizus]KAI6160169.1 hypothetical protein EDD17DRAFT_1605646 [Pisolithus thermaeus]